VTSDKQVLIIYKDPSTLRLTSDLLHDGTNIKNPPQTIPLKDNLEEVNGVVSVVKCTGIQCVLARHGVDLELVELKIVTLDPDLKIVELKIVQKFYIYKGFEVNTLDFNSDHIVISGCRLLNIEYETEKYSKVQDDECGLLIYKIGKPEATYKLIHGGISDKRIGRFLYSLHGLVALG
jgi:hypothetical protein